MQINSGMSQDTLAEVATTTGTRNQACQSLPRLIIILLTGSYIFLALQPDLPLALPAVLAATAANVILITLLIYRLEQDHRDLSPWLVLGLAFLFRLLFLFRSPELSDDIYRYLWDGWQLLHGVNPYAVTPASAIPRDALSSLLAGKVNHPQLVTIYPPFAQLVFAAGAAISGSVTGLKALLVIIDILACFVIRWILLRLNMPASRAILYAWHPLPIIEIAGSGHIDGVGIILFLITFMLLFTSSRKKFLPEKPLVEKKALPLLAGVLFSMSLLTKLIPIIYLPLLLVASSQPVAMGLGLFGGFLLLDIPFLPDLAKALATLGTYLYHWEFSNFAFRSLRNLLSSGNQARIILAGCFTACLLFLTFFRQENQSCRRDPPLLLRSLYGITLAFLLLTPTLHPWYALYLVALLPFTAEPAGMVLSWVVFLSYRVVMGSALFGTWQEDNLTAALIWSAPVLAWVMMAIIRSHLRRKSAALAAHASRAGYGGSER